MLPKVDGCSGDRWKAGEKHSENKWSENRQKVIKKRQNTETGQKRAESGQSEQRDQKMDRKQSESGQIVGSEE
jgi:hypothetical protein